MTSKLEEAIKAFWWEDFSHEEPEDGFNAIAKTNTPEQMIAIIRAARAYAALAQPAALREEPQSVKAVREGFRLLKTLDEGCHGSVGVLLDYIDSLNLAAAQTTEKLNDGT